MNPVIQRWSQAILANSLLVEEKGEEKGRKGKSPFFHPKNRNPIHAVPRAISVVGKTVSASGKRPSV